MFIHRVGEHWTLSLGYLALLSDLGWVNCLPKLSQPPQSNSGIDTAFKSSPGRSEL